MFVETVATDAKPTLKSQLASALPFWLNGLVPPIFPRNASRANGPQYLVQHEPSIVFKVKIWLVVLLFLGAAPDCRASKSGGQTTDHLVFASTDSLVSRYQKLLAQELFKAPSDLGRAVVCPPFEGEFVLSMYSTDGNADLAVVGLVRAQKNIWYAASRLDHDLRVSPNVPVKRLNATMKRRVAFAAAEAISPAIARTRPLAPTERVIVDGTRILFFAPAHAKTKTRSAELDPMAEGDLSQALRRLVSLLEKYCTSSNTERQQVSKEIEAQARLIRGIQ